MLVLSPFLECIEHLDFELFLVSKEIVVLRRRESETKI